MDPGLDLTGLANQMSNLSANNIVGKTIPFERFDDNTPVGSVEIVDPAKVQAFVDNLINPPAQKPATGAPAPATTPSSSAPASSTPAKPASSSPAPIDAQCIN